MAFFILYVLVSGGSHHQSVCCSVQRNFLSPRYDDKKSLDPAWTSTVPGSDNHWISIANPIVEKKAI